MKKIRALSLILASLLTVVNLPLSVNAAVEVTTAAVENFPAEATVSYTSGATVTNKAEVKDGNVTNGYITVDRRLWWKKIGGQVGYGLNQELFSLYVEKALAETKAYYVSFDVRHSVIPVYHWKTDKIATSQQDIRVRINGTDANIVSYTTTGGASLAGGKYYTLPDERNGNFASCVARLETAGNNGKVTLQFLIGTGNEDIPLDFDNVTVWCEALNGDGIYSDGDTLLYSEDYNDPDGEYIDLSAPSNVSGGILYYNHPEAPSREILYHNFDNAYTNVKNAFDSDLKVGYTSLNGGAGYESGSYTFKAQMRVPSFYYTNFDGAGSYTEFNKHKADVTFVYTDGNASVSKTVTTEISAIWSEIEASVTVPYGSTLTGIEITPAICDAFAGLEIHDVYSLLNNTVDIKNPTLTRTSYPEIGADEDETETNYLDGVTVYYDNAKAPKVQTAPEDGYDGHLVVGPRENGNDYYLTFNINTPAVAGRKYYISFNANTDGDNLKIRPIYRSNVAGVSMEETEFNYTDVGYTSVDAWVAKMSSLMQASQWKGGLNNSFIVENIETNDVEAEWYAEEGVSGFTGRAGVQYILNKNETYFEGYFTPAANADNILIQFNRGIAAANTPAIIIDDLKVWYMDGVNEVYVCDEDFNSEEVSVTANEYESSEVKINANNGATLTHAIDCDHIEYVPEDASKPITLTYDLDISPEDAVEGKYTFSTEIKPIGENDTVKVTVTFKYSDGTSDTNYFDISGDWTKVGKSEWIERNPDLTGIEISISCGAQGVMIRRDVLTIKYKYAAGKPNSGVAMILFKKLQGGMVKPINGYLLVGQRIGNENNYLTFDTGVPAEAGRTYYVGFDIGTTDGKNVQIRPFYDAPTNESQTGRAPDGSDIGSSVYKDGGFNNYYLVNTKDNRVQADWYGVTNADGTEGPKELVMYTVSGAVQHFDAYFTPVDDAESIKFHFHRGTASNQGHPMIIDNIKVWYIDGEEKVYVYDEDFNSEEAPVGPGEGGSTVGRIVGNNGVNVSHVTDAAKKDNSGAETETEDKGQLLIGVRKGTEANYVTFDLDVPAKADVTYYVGFGIKTTDGSNVQIRPIYSGETNESLTGRTPDGKDIGNSEYIDGGFNSPYLVNSSANRLRAEWYGASNADGSIGPKELVMYTVTGTETYFEGYFTPTADSEHIKFHFNRGTATNQTAPMLLDDLKVWYMDGGKQVMVYDEDFSTDSALADGRIIGNNGVSVSRYEG